MLLGGSATSSTTRTRSQRHARSLKYIGSASLRTRAAVPASRLLAPRGDPVTGLRIPLTEGGESSASTIVSARAPAARTQHAQLYTIRLARVRAALSTATCATVNSSTWAMSGSISQRQYTRHCGRWNDHQRRPL
jgi:hypothetical protein